MIICNEKSINIEKKIKIMYYDSIVILKIAVYN